MTVYNYYIDKRKYHKEDSFVDVILDYPIEVTDYEYLKVKLCDFKFLNNIYNISAGLMNNKFNIRRYSKTYTYTFGSELYLSDTGFYDDQNALLVSEVIDTTNNTSKIAYDDITLTYYNTTITDDTLSYWQNILADSVDNANRKIEIIKDTSYIEIQTANNEKITSLETIFYKDSYTGTPVDVVIAFDRYDTDTNQFVNIESTTLTFNSAGAGESETYTFTYSNPVATSKYRLRCTTASLPFTLYITKLQANKQIPVFDTGTIDEPVIHSITIPDGFYKSSNLKNTLNDLLSNYKISISIDAITNKIKFSNDNTAYTPSVDDLIDDNFQLDLAIPDIPNMLENLGIGNHQEYINVPFNSYYESDTHINLINLSKIIITTNLAFQQKTHNELIKGNDIHRGLGNILCWVDLDIAPLTCVNYRNYEDMSFRVENKHINSIRLSFYSEKSQPLYIDNSLIHLQIKKLQKKTST